MQMQKLHLQCEDNIYFSISQTDTFLHKTEVQ